MNVAAKIKPKAALPLSKQRLRLWIRILRAARAIEAEVRDRLRINFDVTLPQFDVMAALERKPDGMTMTELSRFLMVSNGNVTGIIDRLVTDKLVVRQAPANDRRAIIVKLTTRGLKDFTAMAKAHQGWVDNLLSEFDAAEAETLIEHLDGLSGRIRNGGTRS
ncbi:MAG TPA: MarR family transcriptional regulator [Pseudolabrys sp.]|jgi:DNA-binding MarR family transcriptional regulator|nr:MarR family transcriptional regulator [Pseudolabrys sp.]